MHDPTTLKGFFSWAILGFGGAIAALLIAYLFPTLIPGRAAATQL